MIGLITPTEYLRITLNPDCIDIRSSYTNARCGDSNYLFESIKSNSETYVNTISGRRNTPYHSFVISNTHANNDPSSYNGGIVGSNAYFESYIRPVVFIKNSVILLGSGTKENPYIIK